MPDASTLAERLERVAGNGMNKPGEQAILRKAAGRLRTLPTKSDAPTIATGSAPAATETAGCNCLFCRLRRRDRAGVMP